MSRSNAFREGLKTSWNEREKTITEQDVESTLRASGGASN